MSNEQQNEVITEEWRPNQGPQETLLALQGFREVLYGGARGGGKTEAVIMRVGPAMPANRHPKYRALVIRQNAVDLAEWIDRADGMWRPMGVKKRGNPPTFVFPSGGIVRTGHLKDESAFNKYLGHNYHVIAIEELTQIPDADQYLRLVSACRSKQREIEPCVISTTNPGGSGHGWVKERFVAKAPPGTPFRLTDRNGAPQKAWGIYVPARLEDNPHLSVADPEYEAFLLSLPEALARAWRYGDWDSFVGQYFPEFRRDLHVVPPFTVPPHWRRYRAIDWGYWPDPWVCLWLAVDEDGGEWLYREASGHRMTPEEVAREILRLSADDGANFGPTVADPSMWAHKDGVSSAEKMMVAGLPLEQGNNTRVEGWMRVHEYLRTRQESGKPWLRIFSACLDTIRTIPEMTHDTRRVEDCADNPRIDHWPDALRYHFMRRPGRASALPPHQTWRSRENFLRLSERYGQG